MSKKDEAPETPEKVRPVSRKVPDAKAHLEQVSTTGHQWDGIEEYDNPMPRWWLWTFYACIFWAVCYTIAFPAWPMVVSATPGLLNFSTRQNLVQEMDNAEAANAAIDAELASVELTSIPDDPDLNQYAISKGAAVYRTWCAQCHGSGAAGAKGYPNLLDDDWLWGGTIEDIHYTITHGIRNEVSLDSRYSQMPVYGEIFEPEEITQVVNYVQSLSGEPRDAEAAAAGEEVFLNNCSGCHGEDGKGDIYQGAPNLTDAVWLYGGDYDTLVETVTYSRYGVMPPWSQEVGGRLTESQVRAVSAYVHQLGGGVEMDAEQ